MKSLIKASTAALIVSVAASSSLAGGFDRGGVNIDQLLDNSRFGLETGVTFVTPQREITNVRRVANEANPLLPAATANSIDVDLDYVVPTVGFKASLTDDLSCLASFTQPYGADANYGTGNAYSISTVEFEIKTRDYGLTCGYKFDAGETSVGAGFLNIIAGASYQQLDGFQSRQRFLDVANAGLGAIGGITNTAGIGFFDVDGDAVGWRVGLAYEIPDIALRAAFIYHSKYDYDLSGVQNNTGFGPLIPGIAVIPVTLETEIPQAIEIRLQTGINEQTLAFLNLKWQDWSQLGIIPIVGGRDPITGLPTNLSFDPLYRDGITVSGGIGRKINDQLSALVSLGWDRGTATIIGTQTDTWTLGGGISYKANENFEIQFGGLVGLLTSGTSIPSGGDLANNVSYSFGNDFVGALNLKGKIRF